MQFSHRFMVNLLALTFLLISCSVTSVKPETSIPSKIPLTLPSPTLLQSQSPTPTLVETVKGGLLSQLNYLEANMPGGDSNTYIITTPNETSAFAELVRSVEDGNLKHAVELANSNHYRLVRYIDRGDDNAVNYLLQEETPIRKGWGM